jgi:hypothetical protein
MALVGLLHSGQINRPRRLDLLPFFLIQVLLDRRF